MQSRIAREHFPGAAGGGIALADRGDVFAKSREHGGDDAKRKPGARPPGGAVIEPLSVRQLCL
ncbi:conserved hypothetical protein [Burkholderia mallei PRL-20]|uniref:Uncharacterized protein n=1 Tax=Burkholderia pseudomallei (strain 1106a) TaxID=357348 RepID=A3NWY5_BURP0|nr:conserved hypothetical protein [Burkholderia mallei SAVP1]ABN89063.1 conserved hypothetical protein [Burkholderia pseudomallei 1106a]EEC36427.1 conserved hypothetical protein [Burkholderia pseudomallei 576]EEP87621.1 conserved hypothetical protein [Burkholderia mallei GB8 horse 4]EES27051.1 conserved hypothetical protein [Burkholderia pseudomallei 1106b]EES44661.1 conserved hypothetical protein [Burkholderia mallei PRL-20]